MNRITKKFNELKENGQKALIPYVTAGDPSIDITLQIMQQLVASGADILELGMPFSDPVADGVVIQAAHQRALNAGITVDKWFNVATEFRKSDSTTPLVFMSYINPIETMGYDKFVEKLVKAGVDGVLIVDLPLDEGEAFIIKLKNQGIAPIFLIAPTTSLQRIKMIAAAAVGFLYVVSLKGVTGANVIDVASLNQQIKQIKHITDIPIAVGFGVRDSDAAKAAVKFAEGVIVGSAFVTLVEQNLGDSTEMLDKIAELTSQLRTAIAP